MEGSSAGRAFVKVLPQRFLLNVKKVFNNFIRWNEQIKKYLNNGEVAWWPGRQKNHHGRPWKWACEHEWSKVRTNSAIQMSFPSFLVSHSCFYLNSLIHPHHQKFVLKGKKQTVGQFQVKLHMVKKTNSLNLLEFYKLHLKTRLELTRTLPKCSPDSGHTDVSRWTTEWHANNQKHFKLNYSANRWQLSLWTVLYPVRVKPVQIGIIGIITCHSSTLSANTSNKKKYVHIHWFAYLSTCKLRRWKIG